MIVKLAETDIKTKYGEYHEMLYYDGQKEIIVFTLGNIADTEGVLCRMHSTCIYGHYINSIECDFKEQLALSQKLIQDEGIGIIFILDQEGKANGHFALMQSKIFKKNGYSQAEAYEAAGFKKDARDFSKVAEILKDLKVKSIRLITDNEKKNNMLSQYGVEIMGLKSTVL